MCLRNLLFVILSDVVVPILRLRLNQKTDFAKVCFHYTQGRIV